MGCDEYIDKDLLASKSAFYPSESVIRFRNIQTLEEVSLKVNNHTCHKTAEFTTQQALRIYNRYHPEICGQTMRKNDHELHFLDHSMSSQSGNESTWKIYFDKSSFTFRYSMLSDSSIVQLDSIAINNNTYYGVYVLPNERISNPDRAIDSVYFDPDEGILQLISSNNETWILLN
jgi:hypothetical protein